MSGKSTLKFIWIIQLNPLPFMKLLKKLLLDYIAIEN
jgi:hypothetical protein